MQRKLLGNMNVDFKATVPASDHIFYIRQILEKSGNIVKQCISYLWTLRKLMIHLVGKSCVIFSLSLVSPCNRYG
jgi:hypothetical protein